MTAILDLTDCCAPPSDSATMPHHPDVDRRGGEGSGGQKRRGAEAGSGRAEGSSAEKGGWGNDQSPQGRVIVPECEHIGKQGRQTGGAIW